MYQLLINTNLSDHQSTGYTPLWQQADTGDDVIAITYQANNIAELKSRQANRSNTITLPRTANNDRIFGLPGEPNSSSRVPYHYLDARLYHNGVELFGEGSKLRVIEANSNGYKVAIYASLFDLFAKMKERKLSEMSLGCVAWDTKSIAKGWASQLVLTDKEGEPIPKPSGGYQTLALTKENSPVWFPLIDWDAKDPSLTLKLSKDLPSIPEEPENPEEPAPDVEYQPNKVSILAQCILPAVKLSWLCEQILSEYGYTLKLPKDGSDDVAGDHRFTKAIIPLVSMKPSDEDRAIATYGKVESKGRNDGWYQFTSKEGNFNGWHNDKKADPMFKAIASGSYTFKITVTGDGSPIKFANFQLRLGRGGDNEEEYKNDYVAEGVDINIDETVVVDIKQNESVWFTLRGWRAYGSTATISCDSVTLDGPVFPSNYLPIALNLPELSQADLFTTLCRLWCLVPVANERDRVLEFFSYDTLYENLQKGNYKDWSDKLDDREHRVSFRWNTFAQKNVMKYKEDEGREGDGGTKEKVPSEAYLEIHDTTLDLSKNLFELPFYACEEAPLAQRKDKVAKIRAIAQGDAGSLSEAKAKLLYLNRSTPSMEKWVWVFENPMKDSNNISVNSFYYASFLPLDMEQFKERYGTLLNGLLADTRLVVEKLWLTPNDMVDFDHSIPIYLSKYGCCFYVNKISNFTPGKLTQVELVALRPVAI